MSDGELHATDPAFVAGPTVVAAGRVGRRADDAGIVAAYDAYGSDLYGLARMLVRDAAAAEDLVAEAFVRLLAEVRAGRPPARVRPWLFRVVANLVVNRGRRRAVAGRVLARLFEPGTAEPADAPVLRAEADAELVRALAALPPDARTALVLAARGFSGREVAEAIGRSDAATRSLLSRARVRLREQLERRETDR